MERERMGKLLAGAATDTGRVREHNEDEVSLAELDSAQVAARGFLVAVADGMGGHERGEVASNLAIEALFASFYGEGKEATSDGEGAPNGDMVAALQQGFKSANERIIEEAVNGEGGGAMGTTMVAAVIDGDHLTVANVGDSRAYLVRAETATQITRDHSLVAEQVAGGVMTAEEARTSNYRNIITRALGHRPKVEVDIFEITLLPEDRVVLCSDGVHGSVEPEEVADLVLHKSPSEASQALIDLAMAHGSTDNVTAAVITYGEAVEAVEEAVGPTAVGGRRLSPVLLLLVLIVVIAVVLGIVYLALNM
jgi:serine/threonine protein phosphatase PrpC